MREGERGTGGDGDSDAGRESAGSEGGRCVVWFGFSIGGLWTLLIPSIDVFCSVNLKVMVVMCFSVRRVAVYLNATAIKLGISLCK